MHKFGAHQGAAVYQALDDAADRNVNIRCVSILLISLMVILLSLN
jgi:hypothetical protein